MLKNFPFFVFVVHAFLGFTVAKSPANFEVVPVQQMYQWRQQQQQQQQQRQSVTGRETNSCMERQTPGPICETCELLSTCIRHSNGWMIIPVETCDAANGFYCNARLGMCSNATGPCHPFGTEGNFQCTSHGIFPDPYDCQKYHVCHFIGAAIVAANVDCDSDKAFNSATGQCSLTLQHPVCTQKQFQCQNPGDAHPWPNNPNIFYICTATSNQDGVVLLHPSLYRCADREIFDGYACRADTNVPNFSTMESTAFPTLSPDSTDTISTTTTPPSMQRCNEIGLSADPNSCHSYYYCSGVNGVLKHLECPAGTYYNKALSACMMGTC